VENLKTLILGIGNSILTDDGIGPRLIQELKDIVNDPDVVLKETSLAGINLMELLVGFDRAIIIDASKSRGKPGEIHLLTPDDFGIQHTDFCSQHNIGLLQAIELGKDLAQHMPEEISIIAIEANDVTTFSENLTPGVEKAIPSALEQILIKISKKKECASPI